MTRPTLLIASPLEEHLVEETRRLLPEWTIRYDARLVPAPRYPGDHVGTPPILDDAGIETWQTWLSEADAMLDFDWWQPSRMQEHCPRLRWVQGTNAGVAAFLAKAIVDPRRTVITTAAGVHAAALAEFVLSAVLHHVRGLARLEEDKNKRRWVKHASSTLLGRRTAVLGQGATGRAVTERLEFLGACVQPFDRMGMAELVRGGPSALGRELAAFDIVVSCLPSTPLTMDLLDAETIDQLRSGCLVVNVGRGDVLDEDALCQALHAGRLGGAVLDVTRKEPLPEDSPLWSAPRLVLSQHSAANTPGENERILQIAVENARRLLDGTELLNLYDPARHY